MLKIIPILECKCLKCCSKLFCFISLFYSPAVTFCEGGESVMETSRLNENVEIMKYIFSSRGNARQPHFTLLGTIKDGKEGSFFNFGCIAKS